MLEVTKAKPIKNAWKNSSENEIYELQIVFLDCSWNGHDLVMI